MKQAHFQWERQEESRFLLSKSAGFWQEPGEPAGKLSHSLPDVVVWELMSCTPRDMGAGSSMQTGEDAQICQQDELGTLGDGTHASHLPEVMP